MIDSKKLLSELESQSVDKEYQIFCQRIDRAVAQRWKAFARERGISPAAALEALMIKFIDDATSMGGER